MRFKLQPQRIWSAFPAILFAGVLCFSERADATESRQLYETRVVEQIQSYCAASWRNANIPRAEWSDCTQQVFAELLERLPRQQLTNVIAQADSRERRELNRSIWRIVKRWRRAVRPRSLNGSDASGPTSITTRSGEIEILESVLQFAANELTPRQSRILALLRDGYSVRDISQKLDLAAARISDEKYRAIQKIRRHLA